MDYDLFPDHCKVCDVHLNGPGPKQQHYSSQGHLKKTRASHPAGNTPSLSTPPAQELNMSGRCDLCDVPFTGSQQREQHFAGSKHAKKLQQAKDPKQPSFVAPAAAAVVPGSSPVSSTSDINKYAWPDHCNVCNVDLNGPVQKEDHYTSPKHKKKAGLAGGDATDGACGISSTSGPPSTKTYFCGVCQVTLNGEKERKDHFDGARHKKNMKTAEEAKATAKGASAVSSTTGPVSPYESMPNHCALCNADLNGLSQKEAHYSSEKHKKKEAAAKDGRNDGAPNWHDKPEILRALDTFHHDHARQPTEKIKEAKPVFTHLVRDIVEEAMKAENLCKRLAFAGSSYQGVKLQNDLEFDVVIIIDGTDIQTTPLPGTAGHVLLKPKPGKESFPIYTKIMDEDGNISSDKSARRFFGLMTSMQNNNQELKKVKFRLHGPAVQMDVHNSSGNLWFSVDLVPTYELSNNQRYVAKRPKAGQNIHKSAWYQSFAIEETEKFDGLDEGSLCRKKSLRILKAIMSRVSSLKALSSYHLKTLLMREVDKPGLKWTQHDLARRVFGLLAELKNAVTNKNLPHYYLSRYNLMAKYEDVALTNMAGRLQNLLASETEFTKLLLKN